MDNARGAEIPKPIVVKLSSRAPRPQLLRQTPGAGGQWGECQFLPVNDATSEADFWFVLEGIRNEETVRVSSGNVVLLAFEPPDIKKYHPEFLQQFDAIYCCHPDIRHDRRILTLQGQPWIVGEKTDGRPRALDQAASYLGYDDFKTMQVPTKTGVLSAVTSDLNKTTGHRQRLALIKRLSAALPTFDFFGRGHDPVPDKLAAILPYSYHLVLENCAAPDYATEKLSDSFLGFAYPIYWGAPNILDYFPGHSLLPIDISDPAAALKQIIAQVQAPPSDQQFAAMIEARALVLDKYNLFSIMASACAQLDRRQPAMRTIHPQEAFAGFRAHQVAHRTARWLKARLRTPAA